MHQVCLIYLVIFKHHIRSTESTFVDAAVHYKPCLQHLTYTEFYFHEPNETQYPDDKDATQNVDLFNILILFKKTKK